MPLLSFFRSSPDDVHKLSIQQIVASAGDGHLRDGTECQTELREYLRQVTVEDLSRYAEHCLATPFEKSGVVLQDIVNELGRRLDYTVTNGRYQGTSTAVGFDGLWKDPDGHTLIVEVKTTDAYRLSLDTVAKYRDRLLAAGEAAMPCSIMVVVGRTDTGELEAQVRGSRHAWDIRLISVDALFNLVRVKQNADSVDTVSKIRRLLTPIEYTRVDALVDVVFTAARDVETSTDLDLELPNVATAQDDSGARGTAFDFTPCKVIDATREAIVLALGKRLGVTFIRKTRAWLWDPEHRIRLVCTVSKLYPDQGISKYWFAYHPNWHDFLSEGEQGFLALGGVNLDVAFAVPVSVIQANLGGFHRTPHKSGEGVYYHLKIGEPRPGEYVLLRPRADGHLALGEFALPLK